MNLNYSVNNINFKEGTVIIAGAGPGNIKLVTIKTILALKSADVVIYDSLINKALLKYLLQINCFLSESIEINLLLSKLISLS